MQINFYQLNQMSPEAKQKLLKRSEMDIENLKESIQLIIDMVQAEGDKAVLHFTELHDRVSMASEDIKATEKAFDDAEKNLPQSIKTVIERSAANIKKFHQAQMPQPLWFTEIDKGVLAGEKVTPISSVGIYVPRGKGSFPSVMLMLCIPAVIANVSKIVVCTPPQKDGTADHASLVAARVSGVKDVYQVGGPQAIAAMAFGTETIPKVDKIIGPGSSYVSAAKRLLFGKVDVGLPAGPSESIILADEKADPSIVALDLLIEAEHGPDSAALLVTHSLDLAQKVMDKIFELIDKLPAERKAFCEKGFSTYGGVVYTETLEKSIEFINEFAPEHLELLVEEPMEVLSQIVNAGEILLGKYTPITISNFCLGVNAILPTGGFAKTFSSVTVHDFLKRSSIGWLSKEGYENLKPIAQAFAQYEGFPAHAMALRDRNL
jgi:histidinol dehydrogenase